MSEDTEEQRSASRERADDVPESAGWKSSWIGWGAGAAVASAVLALAANLSEVAGWLAPDETRELVEETRGVIEDTDEKVEELLVLLRNQAAASGLSLDVESEATIRDAVQAIVASSNAQKQQALTLLDTGDVMAAANQIEQIARNQSGAVSETSAATADSWREAGALYYTIDLPRAVASFREAARLEPEDIATMDLLGYALNRAGELDEAAAVFHEILARDATDSQRSSAHAGLAYISKQRGNYDDAEMHYRAAQAAADPSSADYVWAVAGLGQIDLARGRFDSARDQMNSALTLAEERGMELMRAQFLGLLGNIAARQERFDDAERLMQESLAIHKQQNNLAGSAIAIGNLGALSLSLGDLDAAESRILESVELGERLGWQSSLAYDLVNLAAISAFRSDFATADVRLSRAQDIAVDVGLNELTPVIIFNRGEMARDAGNAEAACEYWLEALPLLEAMQSSHVEYAHQTMDESGCVREETPGL